MKHIFSIIIASLLLMTGCQKTPEDQPKDNATLIQGSWNVILDRSYERYTEPDWVEMTLVSDWAQRLQLDFSADGELRYTSMVGDFEDSWTDRYTVEGDTMTWDVRPYRIVELDDHHLIMESTLTEVRTYANGQQFETTATKHYEMERM